MAFVASAISTAVGGGLLGAVLGGAASGALIGGGVAAITGGDVGKGILMGGLTGGIGGGVISALGGPASAAAGSAGGTAGEVQSIASSLQVANPSLTAAEAMNAAQVYAQSGYTAAQMAQAAGAQSLMNAVPGLTTQSAMNWANQGYTAADMANIASQGVSVADLNAAAAQFPTQAGLIQGPAGAPSAAAGPSAVSGPSPAQQAASQAGKSLLGTGSPLLDKVLGIGLAAAPSALAYNAATKSYIDPSQFVVDPLTGAVVSSSVVTPSGTKTSLDPRVTQLQNQVSAGLTPIEANLQNLYARAGQEAGGYVQSVVDPLTAQAAGEYGKLVSGMGARGLAGSSLAGQELANFTTDTGRAIADARSKALMESLGLQQGLTTAQLQPLAAKRDLAAQIADVNLQAIGRGATGAAAGATQAQLMGTTQAQAMKQLSNALGQPYALTP